MLWGGATDCKLELRAGRGNSRRLTGQFPYGKRAVLSDGGKNGRPQKEEFAPKAFAYRVNDPKADIHLLLGHDYDRPLASRGAGTMELVDTEEALTFEAEITLDMAETSWGQDFFRTFSAGLVGGISPGFRIPPPVTVPGAEKVTEEDPAQGRALIRTIFAALLYEISLVAVPAYKDTTVEARSWEITKGGMILPDSPEAGLRRTLNRWRA
jgi:HK97 family phage prohead protease